MNPIITWSAEKFGVEIQTKDEHFVISAQPSMVMPWNDAVRFYKDNKEWRLPSREELLLVAANINKVNDIIEKNRGYEIQGWHWAFGEDNESCAWLVNMDDGYTYGSRKSDLYCVRAVSDLKVK